MIRQGNLAVQLPQKEVVSSYQPKTKVMKKSVVKPTISTKEKLVYLAMVVVFVLVSSMILSRYSLISQYNYEIQNTMQKIEELKESNRSLQVQIDQLSSRDRIVQIAVNELGMTVKEGNVKILSARQ